MMEAEGLEEDSKAAPGPAVKEESGKAELFEKDLDTDELRRFRSDGRRGIISARTGATFSTL